MKKAGTSASLLLVTGVVFGACSDANDPFGVQGSARDVPSSEPASYTADEPFTTDLIAGRHMDIGEMQVWNDADVLNVKYVIDQADWCIYETHMHVATSLADLPQTKKGNPKPGHFDNKMDHECVTEFTYIVELVWAPGTELFIAAHADVSNGEGAWAAGPGFPGRNWATYFNFTVTEMMVQLPAVGPAVRWRSFGDTGEDEVYLGVGNLGADERVASNFGSTPWGSSNSVSFAYDPANDKLTTQVQIDQQTSFSLEYPNFASELASRTTCTLESLNALVITAVAGDPETTVIMNGINYNDGTNDIAIGDWSGTSDPSILEIAEADLGVDFRDGFTITGTLALSGSFGVDPELSRFEIAVTCPSGA